MTVRDLIRRRLGAVAVLTLGATAVVAADPPPLLEPPPVAPAGGAVPPTPVVPAIPLPPTAPAEPKKDEAKKDAKPAEKKDGEKKAEPKKDEPKPAAAPILPPPPTVDAKPAAPLLPPPVAPTPPAVPAPPTTPTAPPAAGLPPLTLPPLGGEPAKPSVPAPAPPKPPEMKTAPVTPVVPVAPVAPAAPPKVETAPAKPDMVVPKVELAPVTPVVVPPTAQTVPVVKPADVTPIAPAVKPVEVTPIAPAVKPVEAVPVFRPKPTEVAPVAPKTESPMSAPTPPPAAGPAVPSGTARPSARADGLAAFHLMIAEAKVAYSRVRDYSGHMIRQDRVRGVLQPEQTAEVRAKTQPASLYLKWIAPAGQVGREAAYIANRHAGRVRVKPAGVYGTNAWVTVEPTDPKAMADARVPLSMTGVGPIVARLERLARIEAQLRNPVFVTVGEYTYAGKPVVRYEAVLEQPHALREAYRVVVYIDPETKLPVRWETYDQPAAGGDPAGELLECCSFVNLKYNQGLPDSLFDR